MFDVMTGFIFVIATIGLTLGCYFVMRWLTGGDPEAKDRDLASSVIFRISALHGLILALVFAQEMVEYQQLRFESTIEANAIADIYNDARRYGTEDSDLIRRAVATYLDVVVGEEWETLSTTGRLSGVAWGHWHVAYGAVLDLDARTPRQESLRDHMLEQIHTISATRVKRESHTDGAYSGMFWFAAVSGVVFIALAYYSFPPERYNVLLISMFGAFTGIILFFIYAFSNPYSPPGAIHAGPYLRLIDQIDHTEALD